MRRFTFFSFRLIDVDRRSFFNLRFLEFASSNSEAATKQELEQFKKEYLVNQANVAAALRTATGRLSNVGNRLTNAETEIANLKNGDVSTELADAVTALNAQVDALDPQTPAPTTDPAPAPDQAPAPAAPAQ